MGYSILLCHDIWYKVMYILLMGYSTVLGRDVDGVQYTSLS